MQGIYGNLNEPIFGLVYGDFGIGKTLDVCYALPPEHAFYVGPVGAFAAVEEKIGSIDADRVFNFETIDEVTMFLLELAELPKVLDTLVGVVIDDLSVLVKNTARDMLNEKGRNGDLLYPQGENGGFTGDGALRYWPALDAKVLDLRNAARNVGVHVFCTGHEKPPGESKDMRSGKLKKWRGNLEMPSTATMSSIPYVGDLLLRAHRVGQLDAIGPHKVAYYCEPASNEWATKDRLDMAPRPRGPLNIAEIIRASKRGYRLPRRSDLEPWGESAVEDAAGEFLAALGSKAPESALKKAWNATLDAFESVTDASGAYWLTRDAAARAQIRRWNATKSRL